MKIQKIYTLIFPVILIFCFLSACGDEKPKEKNISSSENQSETPQTNASNIYSDDATSISRMHQFILLDITELADKTGEIGKSAQNGATDVEIYKRLIELQKKAHDKKQTLSETINPFKQGADEYSKGKDLYLKAFSLIEDWAKTSAGIIDDGKVLKPSEQLKVNQSLEQASDLSRQAKFYFHQALMKNGVPADKINDNGTIKPSL
jgi:hypothetical protein